MTEISAVAFAEAPVNIIINVLEFHWGAEQVEAPLIEGSKIARRVGVESMYLRYHLKLR